MMWFLCNEEGGVCGTLWWPDMTRMGSDARPWSHTCAVTPSVACTMSRQIPRSFRDVAGMSRYTPPPPPKDSVALFSQPLCRSCARSVLESRTDVRLEVGSVALKVLEVWREHFFSKTDRATQVVAATLTPIALHCAMKYKTRNPSGT